jgi:hypothetical protein
MSTTQNLRPERINNETAHIAVEPFGAQSRDLNVTPIELRTGGRIH